MQDRVVVRYPKIRLKLFGCFEKSLKRGIAIFGSGLDFKLFFLNCKMLIFLRLKGG